MYKKWESITLMCKIICNFESVSYYKDFVSSKASFKIHYYITLPFAFHYTLETK